MTARRALVTGAHGRIGRVLLPRLQAAGFGVVATSHSGVHRLDLADEASIRSAVAAAHPDVVVNLGGVVGAACAADPQLTHRVNVVGAVTLAAAARDAGASLVVQASTAAVYGTDADAVLDEDAPLGGRGAYADSKRDAEERLAAETAPGFATVSARIFNVWGADFPDSLVARLARSAADGAVELHGWTRFVRDYIHVDDVADALAGVAAADPAALPPAVNVATGEGTSNEELVAVLHQAGIAPVYRVTGDAAGWSRGDVTWLRALGVTPQGLGSPLSRERILALG
ncbi:NAD-dependent epimerase/dehydratase family protein [Leifsonia sp. RAF41]|uniref:NAD-dependent epimerase/dehydratase family protein n=1 Tax=Leifsonia sp. RAF41 TaxID=3233056 RepID=UPI003F94CA08